MGGIGLVLNIAKDALLAQQYAMAVVSHNIANVSTDGYTRQTPLLNSKRAEPFGGFMFGRGVELQEIVRNSNSFLEKRLQNAQSDSLSMSEKAIYMDVMESIFNENSSQSLSSQFTDFWNVWNDLANNPSGQPERNILNENGNLLAQSFNDIYNDLTKLGREIDNSIETGVDKINNILTQIADINEQILVIEVSGNANDLRDQRNKLAGQLSEYLDVNTYEADDGSLTVMTGKGYILANRVEKYTLSFDGSDINWQSSGTAEVTITDTISGGKIGGWLDMRDEIIPKYQADLNELAKSTIWEMNKIHTQGVGLYAFSTVTGTYTATDKNAEMGTVDSGLDFYDKITDGSFKIWLYDTTGAVVGETTIPIIAGTTTLDGLAGTIENITIGGEDALNASVKDNKLYMEIDTTAHSGYTFAFSDDTSNILAALGFNTFFDTSTARDIRVNEKISSDKNYIAAAKINNNVGPAVGATTNSSTVITTTGPYTGSQDATYNIEITTGGTESTAIIRWNKDGGGWTSVNLADGSTVTLNDGVSITFTSGTYVVNNTFTVDVTESSDTYGEFAPGDNTNALDIANLQYQGVTIKRWTYERGSAATSQDVTDTAIDDYLHMFIGSVGIQSQSILRQKEYKNIILSQLSESRDNISAVSLDEEMTDLIKYQQVYSAVAKLITTADEMLNTLLNTTR
ncbi:MAG: flagellar hook-associated protein FlgK [Deltaproteobacteria bacterium]|nr:flagellar hook-associated protein FlgK [Deltaproteobacteria bacterium]